MLATILVLGAPAALVLIPWAMVTGNATPLYNVAIRIVRVGLLAGGHPRGNIRAGSACRRKPHASSCRITFPISTRRRCCRASPGGLRLSSSAR